MKKLVIAGSVSLLEKIEYWKKYWEDKNYTVIDYPSPVSSDAFLKDYPQVHKNFFQNITEADVLFIMNEDKNNISGYLGAETFAEMCFGVAQNLIYNKNIEIILLQMPDSKVQSYDEVKLWLKLGWIKLLQK